MMDRLKLLKKIISLFDAIHHSSKNILKVYVQLTLVRKTFLTYVKTIKDKMRL